jgi:hypothetical protein
MIKKDYSLKYKNYWKLHDPYTNTKPKVCNTCKVLKERIYYYRNNSSADGLQSKCKICTQKLNKYLLSLPNSKALIRQRIANKNWKSNNKQYWLTHDPYTEITTKKCGRCKQDKSSTAYSLCRLNIDGLHGWCNDCIKNNNKQNLAHYMFKNTKSRALKFGIEFNITEEDIIIENTCPVLGISIEYVGNGKPTHNSPSIDRIDNNKGYVKGNVRVISWRANNLKRDATVEELEKILADLKRTSKN